MLHRKKRGGVDMIVIALAADYKRRELEIRARQLGRRVLMEYAYLNRRIKEAACEVAGRDADIYITEIGEQTGYANSALIDEVSEATYKIMKRRVKERIAERLYLI